jgi:hypothetical protein
MDIVTSSVDCAKTNMLLNENGGSESPDGY